MSTNDSEVSDLINYIRDNQSEAVLADCLAEEAVELAKECMKYARILRGKCPTPDGAVTVLTRLMEEYTDVLITADVFGVQMDSNQYREKLKRWCQRLRVRNGQTNE